METQDPAAALTSSDIASRAAGCRDLSKMGTVEHLDSLAALASGDKSPGVRLSAAAAAADILSRCRCDDTRDLLSDDQRDEFVGMFSRIDPSQNPGIFPILACLDRPKSVTMICGGLRDPRADVRLGAAVGLMRLCASIRAAEDSELEARITSLLADPRHQPDAVAQIARVCAAVGYSSATDLIRYLQLSGTHAETVMEALGVLDGAEHPLQGVWFSDGNDAGETNPTPSMAPGLMVFDARGALLHNGKNWAVVTRFKATRRMFIRRVGEPEAGPAFQAQGRTFYAGFGDIVTSLVSVDWSVPGRETKASMRALEALGAVLDDSAAGHRTMAWLAMAAGQVEVARAALESAIAAKSTPVDCWLSLGDLLWATDKKAASAHYATYAKKGKKKDNPDGMERAKNRA